MPDKNIVSPEPDKRGRGYHVWSTLVSIGLGIYAYSLFHRVGVSFSVSIFIFISGKWFDTEIIDKIYKLERSLDEAQGTLATLEGLSEGVTGYKVELTVVPSFYGVLKSVFSNIDTPKDALKLINGLRDELELGRGNQAWWESDSSLFLDEDKEKKKWVLKENFYEGPNFFSEIYVDKISGLELNWNSKEKNLVPSLEVEGRLFPISFSPDVVKNSKILKVYPPKIPDPTYICIRPDGITVGPGRGGWTEKLYLGDIPVGAIVNFLLWRNKARRGGWGKKITELPGGLEPRIRRNGISYFCEEEERDAYSDYRPAHVFVSDVYYVRLRMEEFNKEFHREYTEIEEKYLTNIEPLTTDYSKGVAKIMFQRLKVAPVEQPDAGDWIAVTPTGFGEKYK